MKRVVLCHIIGNFFHEPFEWLTFQLFSDSPDSGQITWIHVCPLGSFLIEKVLVRVPPGFNRSYKVDSYELLSLKKGVKLGTAE